ncbi:MAG: autoinducer binding domain-containing protein [Nitratireductor sp.]|nr:autoinducer binding domain-containing protein [Nitratireductor sp.]
MVGASGQLGNFSEEVQQAIEKIAAAVTSYDLFRVLKKIAIGVGYDKFIIFRLPEERSAQLADLAIITNWEPELIKAYDAKDLLANSPVIERLASSVLPFHWDIVELNKGRKDGSLQEALDLFRDFGLHNGTYFPVSDKHGGRGALGLPVTGANSPTRNSGIWYSWQTTFTSA